MTRKGGILAAGVLAAIGLGGSILTLGMLGEHQTSHSPPHRIFRLMPAQSDEFSELRILGPDNKPVFIEINYRDGRHGYRGYDASHTLRGVRIRYANGAMALWQEFDKSGRLINGEEFRPDGTMKWSVQLADRETITTRFAQDHSVFSVQRQPLGQDTAVVQYYDHGKVWLEQTVQDVTVTEPAVVKETVWDKTEPSTRLYDWQVDGTPSQAAVSARFYRPGTDKLWYTQHWVEYSKTDGDPPLRLQMTGPDGTTLVLKSIEVFSDSGTEAAKYEFDSCGNNVVVMREPIEGTNTERVYRSGDKLQVPGDFYHKMPRAPYPNTAWDKAERPSL